ncbi:precorrin-2 C(20)-methyltransferase [Candidatus Puniceispirillum sp.]|jgi:precorrin-2/cobalt-factor-2 C20-methyltransferase|uniref:precorrin-2 C(20)-methyltransferase n=1 Tax=Candidatus Puniceispirillum sp. TaxID=2026719 RepID=UPI001EB61E2A|nr:precorrin-2 C(20)-methyltransferase [Candidatus Puniceispirillum sp.]
MNLGTLYGVGTGPGDPQLVTRRAWNLIESAQVIAYPAPDNGVSFARSIVVDAISDDAVEIPMLVPMRSGRMPAQNIYDQGAIAIKAHLDAGRDVIVLCEGDPLFYGSFMYLLARFRDYEVEIIPGITSMTACAAAEAHPLVARNDILTILPAPLDDATLAAGIKAAEAVVIIKVGRHLARIRSLFDQLGYAETARYVSHASLPHQTCRKLSDAPDDAPYFSMIILYKGDDPWL